MKYNPNLIKKYPEVWENYDILGEYLTLVKLAPSSVKDKTHYKCTICNQRFLTDQGAYFHVDVKHEKEVVKIIKNHGGIGIVQGRSK